MLDYITVVVWEGLWGARAKVFGSADDLKNLMTGNRFPYLSREHRDTLTEQIYSHQVITQGRYSLIFRMLEEIEESNYRPLAEVLMPGQGDPQGFWAGLADLGKNSLDMQNADYGGKYRQQLMVELTMFQVGLLYIFISRTLMVGIPIGRILPQHLYKVFWRTWGYAWPWILFYTIDQLRKNKNKAHNAMFAQARVQLQKAISIGNQDDISRYYEKLVDFYRSYTSKPPTMLTKQVKSIEEDLQIPVAERLPPEILFPYLSLLVQMVDTDSLLTKRAIYRQLVSFIDDPEQMHTVSADEAEQVLRFCLLYPPFPSSTNDIVSNLGLGTAAVATTWMGSPVLRRSYSFSSIKSVSPWIVASLGLYGTTWLLLNRENVRKIQKFGREVLLGYPKEPAVEN